MSPPLTDKQREWLRGYAAALAGMSRLTHDKAAVRDALKADGISFDELVRADIVQFDLDELRKSAQP